MKYSFLLFFAYFLSHVLSAQSFKKTGTLDEIISFNHSEYEIMDTAIGDLNRDLYPDLIVIYKAKNEEEKSNASEDDVVRPLVIYLGQQDGTYTLKSWNSKIVLCYSCGGTMGDPYQDLVIKNGYFTVEHYGGSAWRWSRFITFKYVAKDSTWYLHKDGGDSYHVSDPDQGETKVRTTKDFGMISFENYNDLH